MRTTRGPWRSSLPPGLLVLSIRQDEAENATEEKFQLLQIVSEFFARGDRKATTKPGRRLKFEEKEAEITLTPGANNGSKCERKLRFLPYRHDLLSDV
jgi:hypothetical protein